MSKLLINEQPLQFLPTLAKALGNSDKALILQQIQYWLNNPKVGKEAGGRKWIRNTVEEWHKQFPWIASKTVQRYLKDLEDKKILLTKNLNKLKFDRTKWYAIDYNELDKLTNALGQSDQMEGDSQDQRKGTDSPAENGTPSPLQKGTDSPEQYHRLPETTSKTTTENSGKSKSTSHKSGHKFSKESIEYRLAMYLFDKIKQNNPEHKKLTESQKQKWADNIRLMIQRDNRAPQKIKNMIDWCQADDFWKQNILSTAKLRKQYDTMAPKANAQWQSNQQRKRVYS